MFSRASLLSIKQLRAYHEAGVLEPAAVDPQSGYRSYHWSQLTDAAVIRQLRAVDLPLAQVREIVTSSDPDITREVLELHLETMQSRLEEVAQAVGVLQDAVEHPALHTPVHVRHVEATHVLALTGKVSEADFATFLGDAFPQLEATAVRLNLAPSGPCGGLYPHEIADEIEEVIAYLPIPSSPPTVRQPIDATRSPVTATTLPASEMVVAVHQGSYDTIGETYRLLGTWVAKNATPALAPVREVYVVSYGDTDDPADFRTEILWPLA